MLSAQKKIFAIVRVSQSHPACSGCSRWLWHDMLFVPVGLKFMGLAQKVPNTASALSKSAGLDVLCRSAALLCISPHTDTCNVCPSTFIWADACLFISPPKHGLSSWTSFQKPLAFLSQSSRVRYHPGDRSFTMVLENNVCSLVANTEKYIVQPPRCIIYRMYVMSPVHCFPLVFWCLGL